MAILDPKNDPSDKSGPSKYQKHVTFSFDLGAGDSQIAFMPVQVAFRPASFIFEQHSDIRLEVTCSPVSEIKANDALWAEITLTDDFLQLSSVVTAIRLTATTGSKVRVAT